ncbi:conserved unknown protein [Ectocarpus siliculosus]|uniref:Condensin complex subunit 1 C-terminal domain-containing protein n=1 Tax=Ectocarpus siliculosus TaxID=2880 RepID=D7FP86_ECTSI|nr:conserved unknown protein [Ectocarpus siliculosus]|eukprot:CBJ30347.1 conserved unknown protein [Ectocarpus siliculosus]
MGSLIDQTEAALARVLSLCSSGPVGEQDVDALQRHDEAALALLDINDDDAIKALGPWIKCLEAWSRKTNAAQGGEEGPWTTVTQPCTAVLSRADPSSETPPPPPGTPPLAAHKALTVILFRVMLLGEETEGSPHRNPSPAAWAAARAYLLMLSLPGAAPYGVLQSAVLGMVLTNLRSWCRNSGVYRPGGGGAPGVEGGGVGRKKGPQKRRRGKDAEEGEDGDSSDGGDEAGPRGVGRCAAGGGGRWSGGEVLACLELLKSCLACVPLESHQELVVKLSEVLVGVSVVAAIEGPASLADLASASMVGLVTGASGHTEVVQGVVLQALMPVILMTTGKADVPPRSRDCVKAHNSAIDTAKAIAAALRNAATKNGYKTRGGTPSTPGQSTDVLSEGGLASQSPSATTPAGGGDDTSASPTGDDSSVSPGGGPVVVVGKKGDGDGQTGTGGDGGKPVLTLLQHLCVSSPERAEGRARLAEGLAALLPELEEPDRVRFVVFLAKLSRSAKIVHRGFSVELSSRLLTEDWPWATDDSSSADGSGEGAAVSTPRANGDADGPSPCLTDGGGRTMLDLVVARAADTAPTVRSKAASTLSEVLSGIQGRRSGYKGGAFQQAVMEACGWGEAGMERRHDGPLLETIRTRVEDEKANVRRNAVPALEAILKLSPAFSGGRASADGGEAAIGKEHEADFELLQERCNDMSLSTRKAAMGALSSLLMLRPSDESLQKAWVSSVLPLAGDPEQTCQTNAGGVSSVWPLLAKAGQGGAHKCLKKESWTVEDMRLISLAEKLPRASLTTIRRGTWVLLEAFLDRAPSAGDSSGKEQQQQHFDMDPMFVVRCWNRIRVHILEEALSGPGDANVSSPGSGEAFEADGRRVLGVLARLAGSVPPDVAMPLAESLLEMLQDLVATPETSAALVAALHMLCFAQATTEEAGAAMCNEWANSALTKFEQLLDVFVYQGSEALRDHSGARACGFDMAILVERLIFAVGEVALVGFTSKEDAAGPSDPQAPGAGKKSAEITARPTASPRLVELVQVLLPPRLPTSAHGVEEGEEGPETPSPVRALAFVTLGKLCLRDKALAKRSVNLFVRELDTAAAPAVRSNALVVLGDLCVRYTAMVDRHVAAMAACLQDPHPLVRRHAILLISQLLLQDYVKWRGLLLYRFLATLVDSDASVRDLGAFTLTRPLITKTPGLFAQNFVETLFVLNNYSEHPCYAAAAAGRADAGGGVTMDGIDLGGDNPAQIRRRISVYSTMLEHMSDEQKITVTAKLAQEVLSAVIDGGLPLANSTGSAASNSAAFANGNKNGGGAEARKKASSVVKDALTIMASAGIRVGGRGGAAAATEADDGSEDMGSQQSGAGGLAAAKRTLLSKVALKHLMEKVVPILTALKHVLERAHSPLLREIMSYFGELFRSHKEEVKAVLASEPGLVDEIDFDLRRFEKEEYERRQKVKEAAAIAAVAVAASGAGSGMGPPRTPSNRRRSSMGGGGASGRRGSFAGQSMRDACTPMAAVQKSARKTPFQNLGACSAVKLKASTPGASSMFSPVRPGGGGRGSRPKTPVQLRTPRQAVAAALGNSPMDTDTSPVPIRNMLSDRTANDGSSGPSRGRSEGVGGADIELASPVNPHPAKKRRWAVSVPLPTEGEDGDSGEEEFDGGGVSTMRGGTASTRRDEEESDNEKGAEAGVGGKENNPLSTNRNPSSDGNSGDLKRSGKGKTATKSAKGPIVSSGASGGKGGGEKASVCVVEQGAGKAKSGSRNRAKQEAKVAPSNTASATKLRPVRRSSRAARG